MLIMPRHFLSQYEMLDAPLKDDKYIALHFMHSLVWYCVFNKKITYAIGMSEAELWELNKDYFEAIIDRFRRERGFIIGPGEVRLALKWFLAGVEFIDRKSR